jgi:hypothetical protein
VEYVAQLSVQFLLFIIVHVSMVIMVQIVKSLLVLDFVKME